MKRLSTIYLTIKRVRFWRIVKITVVLWLCYDFIKYNTTPPFQIKTESVIPKPAIIQGKDPFAFDFANEKWIYKNSKLDTRDYKPYSIKSSKFEDILNDHIENNFEEYFENYEQGY